MSDERPLDLKSLLPEEPGVVKAAMRQFRRRVLVRSIWVLVFALAAVAIVANHRQDLARASVSTTDAGFANGIIGNYKVGDIDIGVLKVERLAGDRWGMVIVLHRPHPFDDDCCSLYPASDRVGVETVPAEVAGSNFEQNFVDAPMSLGTKFTFAIGPPQRSLGSFTVDLQTLDLARGDG